MTPTDARWAQIKALFEATVDAPAGEREALIAAATLDASALVELRSLLHHHDAASAGAVFLAETAAQALAGSAARSGQRLGAWQIVRAIGSGGMGEVFEAQRADGSYEGRAAVKLLKRGMDSAAVLQRFAQERQALARLSHPHIARLLDAGASAEGLPYFVLEYVDGRPIDEAVRGLALPARLQLFLQLADAVAHAHRQLLVHRDLKPGNVLVDSAGQVKLLDFGIAKALDPTERSDGHTTLGGVRPYTPHYASPEQVRGEPVSTATDIYSLGVLLYQMLTGTRPTGRHATTPAEAARSVLEDMPTRPSRLSASEALDPQWLQTRSKLEGDLDNILLKALEKQPERRYASVDALAADVRAYGSGHPVSVRAASAGYLAAKFVRRHRLPAALAALALLALLGGLAGTAWQWQRAEQARAAQAQRFAQVRMQANRLLFDYHDAILLLPGATPLVARLLADARDDLASLSDGAGDNAALLRELGVAQRRLGELYSTPGRPALGDVQASLALQQQAVATLTRALALQPADAEGRYQLALAQAGLAGALRERGQAEAALPLDEASAATFDSLATAAPQRVDYRVEQVRARLRLSEAQGSGPPADAQLQQAGALLGPLRSDFADDLDVAALYASTQNMRYLAAARDGRWAEGLALLDLLVPVFAQLVARAPDNTLHARDAAINSLSRGTALGQLGRYAEAREASQDGLQRMQRLAGADPANRNASRDVAKLQTDIGWAGLQLGVPQAALDPLRSAVQALQTLVTADPADRRLAGLLTLALATLAEAEASTGDAAEARRQGERALVLIVDVPADASGLRLRALVHQQLARAWRGLGSAALPARCRSLQLASESLQSLQTSGALRGADVPRLEATRRDLAACPG